MNVLSKLLFNYYDSELYLINLFLYINKINAIWSNFFYNNFNIIFDILEILDKEYNSKTVYPDFKNIFKVFSLDINKIKIVLLGQDPYIKKNQADGLSFSVPSDIKIPPSLANIYKEIKNEFPDRNYNFINGNLNKWLLNGIFLLNCSLTVIENKSNSHEYIWKEFSNNLISYIDNNCKNIVFILLGNYAQNKINLIKNNKFLTASHPSPLSSYKGFFNSNIFKKTEEILNKKIYWNNS